MPTFSCNTPRPTAKKHENTDQNGGDENQNAERHIVQGSQLMIHFKIVCAMSCIVKPFLVCAPSISSTRNMALLFRRDTQPFDPECLQALG